MKKFFILILCGICLVGCSKSKELDDGLIPYMDAKEKIINESAILVDVRTSEEYNEHHIEGALLLPLDKIDEESVLNIIENKDQIIIVYCQSGNRSHEAVEKFKELGYDNVYDLGAISNWKE